MSHPSTNPGTPPTTPVQPSQRDTILTLLGRIEAERRGIDLDHLDAWKADMLILELLGEYWPKTIISRAAKLTDAIDAVKTAFVRAAHLYGADE